ncbi:MAG: metalloregulator ArsR/SmtB family transcription factor [Deltaproteobacteria bacterium]|nr:metalloregulator ArsR/SmtB family transcription factor [Deltaproteobacteria bacterium]
MQARQNAARRDAPPVDPAGAGREAALAHYDELARLGKALSSPIRLRLLDLLRQGPRSVEVLAERAGVTVANASQHLQQLRGGRLVEADKRGQQVVYRLAGSAVSSFFAELRALAEALLPEMDRLKHGLLVAEPEARAALLARVRAGAVTLLDVRPAEEFEAGHLRGALSVPLAELPARLPELPKGREVVAYCRGPFCHLALEAVRLLEGAGYRAQHLDLGPPDLGADDLVTGAAAPPARSPARAAPRRKR